MSGIHPHDHSHPHKHDDHGRSGLRQALGLTAGFMSVEAVGGWFTGSLALLSDAAHMATDAGALLLALVVRWLTLRPRMEARRKGMSFGFRRAEILGALASGVAVLVLAAVLVFEAFERTLAPRPVVAPAMLAIATLGFLVNLANIRSLRGASQGNLNIRAAYLHVLSDALGSLGAVVAGIVMVTTGWMLIDPLVTFGIAVLMIGGAWDLVKESILILMEASPRGTDVEAVTRTLAAVPGVDSVHDLHVWRIGSQELTLTAHLKVKTGLPEARTGGGGILRDALARLDENHGIHHVTLQVEPEEGTDCQDCESDGTPPSHAHS